MKDFKWRNDLDLLIDKNLTELIDETKHHNYAISKSKDKSKAQIWVALAIINSKLNKILLEKNVSKKQMPKKEIDSILKTLEKF